MENFNPHGHLRNQNLFDNTNSITEDVLQKAKEDGIIESFTPEKILQFKRELDSSIQKGTEDSLGQEDQDSIEKAQKDLASLKKFTVYNSDGMSRTVYLKLVETEEKAV